MDDRAFTIYAIRCKENKKIYIGRTEQTTRERIIIHLRALRKNKHTNKIMQEDFNKYGENSFEFYELETGISFNNRDKEIDYMDLYKTCNEKYGYNTKDQHHRKGTFEIIKGKPEIPN